MEIINFVKLQYVSKVGEPGLDIAMEIIKYHYNADNNLQRIITIEIINNGLWSDGIRLQAQCMSSPLARTSWRMKRLRRRNFQPPQQIIVTVPEGERGRTTTMNTSSTGDPGRDEHCGNLHLRDAKDVKQSKGHSSRQLKQRHNLMWSVVECAFILECIRWLNALSSFPQCTFWLNALSSFPSVLSGWMRSDPHRWRNTHTVVWWWRSRCGGICCHPDVVMIWMTSPGVAECAFILDMAVYALSTVWRRDALSFPNPDVATCLLTKMWGLNALSLPL